MTTAGTGPTAHPPSSTDVARLAGVSQKTVSRVMNDEPYVRPEVREKVLHAARQLGYRPNAAARSLVSRRTGRLGVVSLGTRLHGPAGMLNAVENAARRLGFATTVTHTGQGDGGVTGAIEWLMRQGVDGIVLTGDVDEGPLSVSVEVPVLTFGRHPGLVAARRIRSTENGDRGARAATGHLISLGHTQIRHVAGPGNWWTARDRAGGWRAALTGAGLDVAAPVEGDWTCDSGYLAGRVLAADSAMTAVLVANDEMAIGLIRALREAGRRVPHDVSVVGMDDIPAARYLSPALTTVVHDFAAAADDGVGMLVDEITTPSYSERRLPRVEPVLAVRESTSPPQAPVAGAGREDEVNQ